MITKVLKLIYHHHSGFSVQAGPNLLIFDYWRGEERNRNTVEQLLPSLLCQFENVYVFISHGHVDHLDPIVFEWADKLKHIEYILGEDIEPREGISAQHVLSPEDSLDLPGDVHVTAYPSTDLGVSFHVLWNGLSIFHAGDLNLWHWRDESTIAEINQAEDEFNDCMRRIGNLPIDVCMFPLDPRQGELFALGAERFMLYTQPTLFIPMHWWHYDYAAVDFAREHSNVHTRVISVTRSGTQLTIAFKYPEQPDGSQRPLVSVDILEPPKRQTELPRGTLPETTESPFVDSDLPVSFD